MFFRGSEAISSKELVCDPEHAVPNTNLKPDSLDVRMGLPNDHKQKIGFRV